MGQKKFFAVIAAIILVAGAVVGVMRYFESEKLAALTRNYDTKIADLTRRIGTIERRLGDKGEFLDVRNLWLDAAGVTQHLPDAKYHSVDSFYAINDRTVWSYELTTDHVVLTRRLREDRIRGLLQISPPQRIHVWRVATYRVTGNELYKALVSGVSLQRIPRGTLSELIKEGVEEGLRLMPPEERLTLKKKEELVEQLNVFFLSDGAMNLFLASYQLSRALAMNDTKISFELVRLQKLGNVLYAQYLTTLRDVKVEGQQFGKYYIWSEAILISTERDIYVVETTVPTGEPAKRDRHFSDITQWLGDFAVLRGRGTAGTTDKRKEG